MKKILSIILALVLLMSLATTAMAANVTVDVADNALISGHTFTAYQIFAGDWVAEEDSVGILSNITWGEGIDSNAFLEALKKDDTLKTVFADCTTAAAVAEKMVGWGETDAKTLKFAKIAFEFINGEKGTTLSTTDSKSLDYGYYLIVDAKQDTAGKDEVLNASLLQVVGDDITINVKTDKPTVEKKVQENTKTIETVAKYGEKYNDVADYTIGEEISFRIYSAVPDMTYFDSYQMIFTDTMDDGLSFVENSLSVKIDSTTLESGYALDTTKPTNGFTVTITDLKAIDEANESINVGDPIVIEYKAKLNKDAVIGLDGNVNTVKLQYTNNPNGEGLGETPEDKVIVFTYGIDVTKVDGANTATKLSDAEFVLMNGDGDGAQYAEVVNGKFVQWVATQNDKTKLTTGTDGKIIIKGLDDGTYYLKETKAPAGYNILPNAKTVKVSAKTVNGQDWDDFVAADALIEDETTNTITLADGLVKIQIENNKGTVLPETGAGGTLLFISVGSVVVLAAVIFLVTRKKMSIYED